jgi:hypothetical protein
MSGSKTNAPRTALPPECCCATARADCTPNLELRDLLRVAHRAALPAHSIIGMIGIIRMIGMIGIIGTVGAIGGIGIIGTGVGRAAVHRLPQSFGACRRRSRCVGRSAAEAHIATGLRRGRRRGYPRARGRGTCSKSRRRSAVGMEPMTRTRAFGHGADARPTAGGDNRTVPATNASDGGARTAVNNRRRPNDVIKHGRLRAAMTTTTQRNMRLDVPTCDSFAEFAAKITVSWQSNTLLTSSSLADWTRQ